MSEQTAAAGERWVEYVPLDQLRPNPANPKAHSIEALRESMTRFQFTEPPQVDERTGLLIAGHGRRELLLDDFAAGREPPEGVRVAADGRWLVPVVRGWSSTDDDAAWAYLVAANRVGEVGGWQRDLLAEGLQRLAALDSGVGLVGTGYSADDLELLLAEMAPPPEPPVALTDPDAVPEPPKKPITKPGDLWLLGEHRLLCGDARKAADMCRLMNNQEADLLFADPPYGIGLDIANDDLSAVALDDFNAAWLTVAWDVLAENAATVVFSSSRTFPSVLDAARAVGFEFLRYLTIYKPNDMTFPWRGWLLKSEASLLFQRGKARFVEVRPYAHDTYIQNHTGETLKDDVGGHPAAKQMPVIRDILSRLAGDVVLDPFLGSGSSLIASHLTGRTCFGMEIDPPYCDVTVRRWEELTGEKAVRAEAKQLAAVDSTAV